MGGPRTELLWPSTLVSLALGACAASPTPSARETADANDTGRVLAATSESERALLNEVAKLPSGAERSVAGRSVVADAAYTAASGRTCRALHIKTSTADSTSRLACSDGKAWFFVPDVFGATAE